MLHCDGLIAEMLVPSKAGRHCAQAEDKER